MKFKINNSGGIKHVLTALMYLKLHEEFISYSFEYKTYLVVKNDNSRTYIQDTSSHSLKLELNVSGILRYLVRELL